MFNTTNICNTLIIKPDVVRMNQVREAAIREFTKENGDAVTASIDSNADGSLKSVDLFGGTAQQRDAFIEGLACAVFD